MAYAPNRVTDLPAERERLARPVVYHLLGRVSASPTYVISDEDLLEFICGLQSEHLAPEKLFHELEHSHLLLIGGNFTNWLASDCSCAWRSADACRTRATSARCWPTATAAATGA